MANFVLWGGDAIGGSLYCDSSETASVDLYVYNANGSMIHSVTGFTVWAGTNEILTVPYEWSYYCPNGTSMSVTYEVVDVQTENTATLSQVITIPEDVLPSASVTVSDPTGNLEKYGAFLQGQSTIKVDVKANGMYGSTIKDCLVSTNGKHYVSNESASTYSFTTDLVQASDADIETRSVFVSVTDSRGRRADASTTFLVWKYNRPTITSLNVQRCDADGITSASGDRINVSFSAVVSPLDGTNSATYKIQYKKTADANYTDVLLSQYDKVYEVNDTCIFKADTGSVYNVRLVVTDNHHETTKETTASTAFTIMHFGSTGYSMGLGKVTEREEGLDIGFRTRHDGGLLHPILTATTDLDNVMIPNTYAGQDASTAGYVNCPISTGAFVLEVLGAGADDLMRVQRLTTCFANGNMTYERRYYNNGTAYVWGEWVSSLDKDHPVGSWWFSDDPTSPAALFGGSWVQLVDRTLVGAKNIETGSGLYSVGDSGGEATHTLTVDEMPSHSHTLIAGKTAGGASKDQAYNWGSDNYRFNAGNADTEYKGGSQPHNNMPPYRATYIWVRKA